MSVAYTMDKLAHIFLQLVGAAIMFATVWFVETTYFPVVKDFKVDYITRVGNTYTAGGTLDKARACEFIGLTLYGTKDSQPKMLLTQYKKDIFGSDVGQGMQTWGPWSVQFPGELIDMDNLEIMGSHRCHSFWIQTTIYTNFDMKMLRSIAP